MILRAGTRVKNYLIDSQNPELRKEIFLWPT